MQVTHTVFIFFPLLPPNAAPLSLSLAVRARYGQLRPQRLLRPLAQRLLPFQGKPLSLHLLLLSALTSPSCAPLRPHRWRSFVSWDSSARMRCVSLLCHTPSIEALLQPLVMVKSAK